MDGAKKNVCITGAAGYVGRLLVEALETGPYEIGALVGLDVKAADFAGSSIIFYQKDLRETDFAALFRKHEIEVVVHLAAIVMPSRPVPRALMYEIDVEGTERVLKACAETGVQRFITTSSGAAYGYHADNPDWLTEAHPLRGNYEFAYSYHKRLVEALLADYRTKTPELQQTIFRVGTILGEGTQNQITEIFGKRRQLGIRGSDSPFVVIWDRDLARLLAEAVFSDKTGIYNVAGDGALPVRELARLMDKPFVPLPAWLVKLALSVAKPLGLAPYGPEQVGFMQYRPVLDNRKLKAEFGFTPKKNSREAFLSWWEHHRTSLSSSASPP